MTRLFGAVGCAGLYVLHRLGKEWRHFIRELAIDVALSPQFTKPARRCQR